MAYDEGVANRLRALLAEAAIDRKMFGGIAFLVGGHMCCGVLGEDLVLRLGREGAAAALRRPGVRPMDFTGRPLGTMVYVGPLAHRSPAALRRWVALAVEHARSLPPRRATRGRKRPVRVTRRPVAGSRAARRSSR